MAKRKAISEYRDVIVTFNDAAGQDIGDQTEQLAMPIDAYKAAMVKVEEIESTYATLGAFTDLSGASILAVGSTPYQVHVFELTTTVANGEYMFIYVETVPNAESVT